jgi:hypothetical protein
MKGSLAVVALLALAAGCADEQKPADERVEDYAGNLGTDVATSRQPKGGGAKSVSEKNDVWEFEYAYPAAAGRIPKLRAQLDSWQQTALADLKESAIDARSISDEQGFEFHPYSATTKWEVVTDLPQWLSLSVLRGSYEGGAHPNYGYGALLWDKQGGRALQPASLFASTAALEAAVKPAFCAALDKQRAEKRGEPMPGDPEPGDWMTACPKIGETTVILGSSNSRTFDRIGFLIDPYVAGPYAEGSYEVTLPVTAAVKAAVKPQYAASFTVTR